MILYRYFSGHAFDTLRDRRLLTSKLSGFNDPFEFLFNPERQPDQLQLQELILQQLNDPVFLKESQAELPNASVDDLRAMLTDPRVIAQMQEAMPDLAESALSYGLRICDEHIRIVCFSASTDQFDEVLMWSHYAGGHQGWRIGFDIPFYQQDHYRIDPVTYSKKRVAVRYRGINDDPEIDRAFGLAIRTKSSAWAYEAEHRLTASPQNLQVDKLPSGDERHFLPFETANVARVDLGLKSDPNIDQQIISLIRDSYPSTRVYKARLHPTEFHIVYDQLI